MEGASYYPLKKVNLALQPEISVSNRQEAVAFIIGT